jgi:hypothetical protein
MKCYVLSKWKFNLDWNELNNYLELTMINLCTVKRYTKHGKILRRTLYSEGNKFVVALSIKAQDLVLNGSCGG